MLTSEELEQISNLKRLGLRNGETDYLQEILLFSIYSKAGPELVFKGGTCLYKVYKLNRFSEDLDFTFTGKRGLLRKTIESIPRDLASLNMKASLKKVKEYANEMNVRILINGPLYHGVRTTQSFIPLNISMKENVVLKPNRTSLVPLYAEIPTFELFAMQEKEILAEKVRAILTRDKPRDVYDLWFLLTTKKVRIDSSLIDKKLGRCGLSFSKTSFIDDAVSRKERMWESDLRGLVMTRELPAFRHVKKDIRRALSSV